MPIEIAVNLKLVIGFLLLKIFDIYFVQISNYISNRLKILGLVISIQICQTKYSNAF